MKKYLTLAIAVLSFSAFAQVTPGYGPGRNGGGNRMNTPQFTVEQQATLQTKRMTLNLDLTDSQQKEVYNLNLVQAKQRETNRTAMLKAQESGQALSSDELYNAKMARLDQQIAYKNKMKSILKAEQYALWNENIGSKMNQGMGACLNQGPNTKNVNNGNQGPGKGKRN